MIDRFYRVLPGFTGFYWVLPSCFLRFGLDVPSRKESGKMIDGFYRVLLGFTGFYWVLPSYFIGPFRFGLDIPSRNESRKMIDGFYRVLLGFYRVIFKDSSDSAREKSLGR